MKHSFYYNTDHFSYGSNLCVLQIPIYILFRMQMQSVMVAGTTFWNHFPIESYSKAENVGLKGKPRIHSKIPQETQRNPKEWNTFWNSQRRGLKARVGLSVRSLCKRKIWLILTSLLILWYYITQLQEIKVSGHIFGTFLAVYLIPLCCLGRRWNKTS